MVTDQLEDIPGPTTPVVEVSSSTADEAAPQINAPPPSTPQIKDSPPAPPQLEETQGPKTSGLLYTSKKLKRFFKALEETQGPTAPGEGGSSSPADEVTPEIDASTPATPQLRVNDVVLEPWMTMERPAECGTWADMDY